MPESNINKRKQVFTPRFAWIYALAMTTCIGALLFGLVLFWDFLDSYEKSLPDGTAKQVFAEFFTELEKDKLYEWQKPFVSELETFANYSAYMDEKVLNGAMSYRNIITGKAEIKKYAVFSAEGKFAEFELSQIETSGKKAWVLSGIKTVFDKLEGFDIVVPAQSIVYVNGNIVEANHISGSILTNEIVGIEDVYTIENLIAQPVVEAQFTDGSWRELAYNSETKEYADKTSIIADILEGDTLYINGIAVTDNYLVKEKLTSPESERLKLSYNRYQICGSFGELVLSVVNKAGKEGLLHNLGDAAYIQEIVYSSELEDTLSELAKSAALAYATYMTKDAGIAEVKKYFETDTPTYKAIQISEVYWYTKHIGYRFENVEITEFYEHDEDNYSCRVTLDQYIVRTSTDTRLFPLDITLFFRQSDGKYLVYDMISNK